MEPIVIKGRAIGPGQPPYVIAEMSGNHNGDIGRAFALIEAAKAAGADAVKLQTYTADTITIDCDSKLFRIEGGLWAGRTLHELYQEAHTPWEWHERLFRKAEDLGIAAFSTPFDFTAVDFLNELGAPAFKIASFEAIDLPLIRKAAESGKPLIVSTGMADLGEIAEAVEAARSVPAAGLALLHCVSSYPTPPQEANLRTIPNLAETFDVAVGLSDHTLDNSAAAAAVALGACVIEKHFTLRRADGGPDAAFSLEPEELAQLVRSARTAWQALGRIDYGRKPSEAASAPFRRSLFVVRDVAAGAELTAADIRSIRPGYGLPPKHLPELIGKRAARDLKRGEPVDWTMLAR